MMFKSKIKLGLTQFIRDSIYTHFHHYAWPRRLANRFFDFDVFYPDGLLINLGAGPYFKRKGWISADFLENHEVGQDYIALDLRKSLDGLPFSNVRSFYMSHTLEHFHVDEGRKLLTSMFSALEPGGILRVIVPDADLILDRAREGDREYFRPLFSYFRATPEDKIMAFDVALHLCSQPRCRYQLQATLLQSVNDFEKQLSTQDNDSIIKELNDHKFPQDNAGSLHLAAYNAKLLMQTLHEIGYGNVYRSAFMQSRFGPMREAPIFDGTHPWFSLYVEAVK